MQLHHFLQGNMGNLWQEITVGEVGIELNAIHRTFLYKILELKAVNVLSDFLLEFRLELQWVNEWTFIQAIPYLWTVIIIHTPNPPLEMKCVNLKTRLAHVAQKTNMADNFQYKIFLLQSKHVK